LNHLVFDTADIATADTEPMSSHIATPMLRQLKARQQREAQRVDDAGFTLFEMMIVLALVAMVTAASMGSFRSRPNQVALQPVAALVAADLRSARIEAMQRSRVVEVRFDGRTRTYVVPGTKSAKRFPDNIGFAFSTVSDGLRADYADRLLFFPDGSSTGGSLRLTSSGTNQGGPQRGIVIAVDWLTGSVRQTGGEASR
jgi:general secretion pathway protein H